MVKIGRGSEHFEVECGVFGVIRFVREDTASGGPGAGRAGSGWNRDFGDAIRAPPFI
jgi:hypothetical protein